tara:strand:+ start:436 stop:579 length:144 start_codon:yes stop_codon:yes gene_type:complete
MLRKEKKPQRKDTLDGEIKRLDVAAQTPFEKARRRRRIHQSKQHKVS